MFPKKINEPNGATSGAGIMLNTVWDNNTKFSTKNRRITCFVLKKDADCSASRHVLCTKIS